MMKVLVLLLVAVCVYGDSFYNTGLCPIGRTAGDRWKQEGQCSECYCDATGFGCNSCDVLTPVIGCYTVVNKTLEFPGCCPRLQCFTLNGLGDR